MNINLRNKVQNIDRRMTIKQYRYMMDLADNINKPIYIPFSHFSELFEYVDTYTASTIINLLKEGKEITFTICKAEPKDNIPF